MRQLLLEVDAAYERFCASWREELARVGGVLEGFSSRYRESYRRLVSLQAWRSALLEGRISGGSLAFFVEAQNDALVAHVFASLGSWRSALVSLRSCIENVCFSLYYKDHPVELELWAQGKHTLNFSSVMEYLQRHPAVSSLPQSISGVAMIKKEYPVLSRAVHGSAVGFRMTAEEAGVRLWVSDEGRLGAWLAREARTLCGLNLLLLAVFQDELQAARQQGLRKAVSLAVPASKYKDVKNSLKITLVKQ